MTPLEDVIEAAGLGRAEDLTEEVLRQVHTEGFARAVEGWLRRLEPVLDAQDDFNRERARQLTEAAQLFDETGSRDIAEFVQFAGRHVVRDVEATAVVRVMTIHKSKGLGFDVVVLPDLEGNSLATRRREGLGVQRTQSRVVEWVLDLPPKLFHENDPVLAAHVAGAEADAAYEKLCLFYVAMTRAKRALYLITKPVGVKSVATNFPRLLAETLGTTVLLGGVQVGEWIGEGVFMEGDVRWFERIESGRAAAEGVKSHAGIDMLRPPIEVVRYQARTPSGTKAGVMTGLALFGARGATAASFGTAVHAALAAVEWGGVTPYILSTWTKAELPERAIVEARACLEAVALNEIWTKPVDGGSVWRERTFEIVLDGAWITGIFDRVVLTHDVHGSVVAATVYDFKTDRTDGDDAAPLTMRYGGQLAIYRKAAARLTGLPEDRVKCALVVTSLRCVVFVDWDGAD
jgi:hypothetical protein